MGVWGASVLPAACSTARFTPPSSPGAIPQKRGPPPSFSRARRMQCPPIPIDVASIYAADLGSPLFAPVFSRARVFLSSFVKDEAATRVKSLSAEPRRECFGLGGEHETRPHPAPPLLRDAGRCADLAGYARVSWAGAAMALHHGRARNVTVAARFGAVAARSCWLAAVMRGACRRHACWCC